MQVRSQTLGLARPISARRPSGHRRRMPLLLPCRAAAASQLAIPHELPLFPVQPMGVFLPGMTKTLHLYEQHFISMVDECLASDHKLMATAVLEPFMGEASEADAGPGAFVGGYNFSLSCGCLVQVLSAKPYTGGYLVRIRGEARLGISGLPQTGPYMRAQVYPLPDQVSETGSGGEAQLRAKVEQLRDIMRDVQNLASKFRCDETAALQQAMRWLHAAPITPGIQNGATTHGPAAGGGDLSGVSGRSDGNASSSSSSISSSSGSNDSDGDGRGIDNGISVGTSSTRPMDADSKMAPASSSETSRTTSGTGARVNDVGPSPVCGDVGASALQTGSLLDHQGQGRGRTQGTGAASGAVADAGTAAAVAAAAAEEEGEGEFDAEEAVRLSWASLQWLPHASTEERMYIVRTRLLAMDTRDVGRRLDLALEAMGRARASLAAKCAIKAM